MSVDCARNKLPPWAAGYIGIPGVEKGRDRDGCDCYGLSRLIWREQAGLELPSHATEYDRWDNGEAVESAIRTFGTDSGSWLPVTDGRERVFDAVQMTGFFRVEKDGVERLLRADMHLGVVLAPGTLIHVEAGVDSALGIYWRDRGVQSRIVGFWRHRDLADG